MFKMIGLLAVVPATVLLTISFFVLLTLRKIEQEGLRAFGYVITALLWGCALLVLLLGAYKLSAGHCKMHKMMHCQTEETAHGQMHKMMPAQK